MSQTLKVKVQRGLKANLPILSRGELAYTTDTNEFFVGVLAEPTNVSDNVLVNDIPIPTTSEAETGTNNTKFMTPLRTSEAITAQTNSILTSGSFTTTTDVENAVAGIGGNGLVFDNIDKVYDVDYADNAETLAGSSTTKIITPATLAAKRDFFNISVATGEWILQTTGTWDEVYIATITQDVDDLLSSDVPIIDLDLTSANATNFLALQDEYAKIFRVEASANQELKLYAEEQPQLTLNIAIQVVR